MHGSRSGGTQECQKVRMTMGLTKVIIVVDEAMMKVIKALRVASQPLVMGMDQ